LLCYHVYGEIKIIITTAVFAGGKKAQQQHIKVFIRTALIYKFGSGFTQRDTCACDDLCVFRHRA